MTSFDETVMGRVVGHALRNPESLAVVFASGPDDPLSAEALSYAELDRGARAMAAYLQRQVEPGDRVLVLHRPGIEFVKSFAGCLYAGAVPIACPVPEESGHHLARATGIALDASPRVALTDPAHLPIVHAWADQDGLGRIGCLSSDGAADLAPAQWKQPRLAADDTALLQYTSMTGADHRGVAVSHRNLTGNAARAARLLGWGSGMRLSAWFPLHHATGLIAFLEALVLGATTVQMASADPARHPSGWLDIIDRYGVDVAIAPDTGYERCAGQVSDDELARLDLSRWRQAVAIGRPVRAKTIADFAERFTKAGFRPEAFAAAYSRAEATMIVTGGRAGGAPRVLPVCVESLQRGRLVEVDEEAGGLELVAHGPADGDDIRIVDPASGRAQPAGAIGEVWTRVPGVTRGHWRSDPVERPPFPATAPQDEGEAAAQGEGPVHDGFLRTGDLGAVHAGELYLVGKRDERLVIGGRTIHPEAIEQQVRRLGGLLAQEVHRVFTIPLGKEIAVVLELDGDTTGQDVVPRLTSVVRTRLGGYSRLPVADVVIVPCGTLCGRTGSGLSHDLISHLFAADALVPLLDELGRRSRVRPVPGLHRVAAGPVPAPAARVGGLCSAGLQRPVGGLEESVQRRPALLRALVANREVEAHGADQIVEGVPGVVR
ncbi:AMP-binding protein [Actinomadura sp. KC216]|uniref:AMP-binding protein n=1 Tax=Actinomadura sp. KC216 TaxID=2530370 RepID=UPI002442E42B|nr:AMP-binding protein [Actinomadura sp. KC216]